MIHYGEKWEMLKLFLSLTLFSRPTWTYRRNCNKCHSVNMTNLKMVHKLRLGLELLGDPLKCKNCQNTEYKLMSQSKPKVCCRVCSGSAGR